MPSMLMMTTRVPLLNSLCKSAYRYQHPMLPLHLHRRRRRLRPWQAQCHPQAAEKSCCLRLRVAPHYDTQSRLTSLERPTWMR